jgi:hypothetical protein
MDWLIGTLNDGYPYLNGVSLDVENFDKPNLFKIPKPTNLWDINRRINGGYPFIKFQFHNLKDSVYNTKVNCFRWDIEAQAWKQAQVKVWNSATGAWVRRQAKILSY